MSSRFGTLSGRGQVIGHGVPQTFPIQLDPVPFEGAVVYADNGELRYSDGTAWLPLGTGPQGTQGTTGIQGFQGVQGDYGPGFTIIGSIAGPGDQSSLNTAFPAATVGDGVIDQSDDTLWIYDGSVWVNIGSFRGVQGLQGVQGVQGVQGPIGNEGIQGERGFRGFQGERGVQGVQGIQGDLGIQGIQGRRGPQGVQGTTGIQGVQGPRNFQGTQGLQGVQGTTGIQGDTGFQGYAGSYGGVTFEYDFGASTATVDPGSGNLTFANTAVADVNEIYIDSIAAFPNTDISDTINSFDNVAGPVKAFIKITQVSDISKFSLYEVNDIVDNTGWFTLSTTYLNGSATTGDYTSSPRVVVSFAMVGTQGIQGVQGTTGIQGLQGNQGLQGQIGPQGIQGATGIQGDTGTQGLQGRVGPQGIQGVQGLQGPRGIQGFRGAFGGISYDYTFSTSTANTDPGQGILNFDNASFAGAGKMFIDDRDDGNVLVMDGVMSFLSSVTSATKGFFKLTNADNIYDQATFEITGVTDRSGYWDVDVTHLNGVTLMADQTDVRISFIRNGDQGLQGIQGVQGTRGIQGDVGPQGVQGEQGLQGVQGLQGGSGVQGLTGSQGVQGTTGIQGSRGLQGIQGTMGFDGGLSFEYDFDTNTTQGQFPGLNHWYINNADVTQATRLYIDDLTDSGRRADSLFNYLDGISSSPKGQIFIRSAKDVNGTYQWLIYEFTNWTWDASGTGNDWGHFDVNFIERSELEGTDSSPGTSWANGAAAVYGDTANITFIPAGQTGSQGIQGVIGPQGVQGIQGEQGIYGGLSFQWLFSSNTIGGTDPGTNNFKFNNANPQNATLITIDDIPDDQYNTEVDDFLDFIAAQPGSVKGYLKIQKGAGDALQGPGGHHWLIYEITGWTWDGVGKNYGFWDVTFVDGNVTDWNTQVSQVHGPETVITFIPKGPAGIQGPQGTTGIQGQTGAGLQGVQGLQGIQGFTGLQGAEGSFGGITFDYTFLTDIVNNDPGIGNVKFNNGTYSSVTAIYIDDRDDNFVNIEPFLRTIDDSTSPIKGHVKITKKSQPEIFQIFTISALAELTGYFNITVAFVSGNGTFANSEDVTITFARTGDAGATGAIGPQGVQGIQGNLGIQGLQGADGAGAQGATGADGIQGPAGLQGADGAIGVQGIQGLQGADGSQGAAGFQGAGGTGAQGIQGIQGLTGSQGIGGVGSDGFQGTQGIQGPAGPDGAQGLQGADGGAGQPGPAGAQGSSGPQGLQGIQGIQGGGSAGTQGPAGFQGAIGPQGVQGADGDAGVGVQGPAGIQGIQGTDGSSGAGFQGIQGVQGTTGTQGALGIGGEGAQGPAGPQGIQGVQGRDGAGDIGVQGPAGPQGITGIQGPDGGAGGAGAQGIQGPQGADGADGAQGAAGTGTAGAQGPAGPQGADGQAGTLGSQGPTGGPGPQGVQGIQGNPGFQGADGVATGGIQGFTGAPGPQGQNGFQGTQGTRGFQGSASSGLDGFQGIQGPIGPQGTTGATGPIGTQGPAGSGSATTIQTSTIHGSSVESTPMFVTFVQDSSTARTLYATTSPNPGGQSNFFYTANIDELQLENITIAGSATLGGSTITTWPSGGGGGFDGTSVNIQSANYFRFNDSIPLRFGTDSDSYIYHDNSNLYVDMYTATHNILFRDASGTPATRFTFDTDTGDFTAAGNVNSASDERLKENIETIPNALDKVLALRGVEFNKIETPEKRDIGLIAQEVEKILPEVVSEDSEGLKSISYANLVGLLIEAIKEQQEQIQKLK